jgi:glycosyltransferase involved in cell wall biosynthesis
LEASISAIVCTYTEVRWNELLTCITALRQQTHPLHEIIIVVDHNPNLYTRTRTHLPDLVVIENTHQYGLSGARNTGIAVAAGDIVAFTDDDAIPAPDWSMRLLAGFTDPSVLGVGGAIRPLWQTECPAWFPEEFEWVVGCTYRGMPQTAAPVRNLIGCNMALRRDVFETAGVFREGMGRIGTIPHSGEETELCIRLHQCWPDSVLLYDPLICVQHRVPANRMTWRYFCWRCWSEGVSKAYLSQLVGARDGLSSEWAYALRVLPEGVMRGIADTVAGRDGAGWQKAGAIGAGMLLTTLGYIVGWIVKRWTEILPPRQQRGG